MPDVVIAIDPGRDKCGLAVVRADGHVLAQAVVASRDIAEAVAARVDSHGATTVVVGNRTGAEEVAAAIAEKTGRRPTLIDEHNSTLDGRRRYLRENPPRGWRRLVPPDLQTPPRPYDDYVAVILAERYLASVRS